MLHVVEISLDVGIDDVICLTFLNKCVQRSERGVAVAVRAETMHTVLEPAFKDYQQDATERILYEFVFACRDPHFSVGKSTLFRTV